MLFQSVIGQEQTKDSLIEMVAHNRLSHALLFIGREGSGALPLAIAFAGYLCLPEKEDKGSSLFGSDDAAPTRKNIETAKDADLWMKSHDSFTRLDGLVHPDLHFSYPVISKKPDSPPISTDFISEWREFVKNYPYGNVFDWLQFIGAENKQGNITSKECNDIIRKLSMKSFESGYKVLVMWMPEYLGKEGNKLLKLIEEPPDDTLFILATENENGILPTIVSRCQLIRIPPLDKEDIATALKERNKTPEGQAEQLALMCEGNYRQALQLASHADDDWQSLLRDWISSIYRENLPAQVKWIEGMQKLGREKQKQFLRYFSHMLEQSFKLRVNEFDTAGIPDADLDFAVRLNKIADLSQQQAIAEEIDRASYQVERNAHAKILFHSLTIRLHHIIRDKIVFLNH